MATFPSSAIQRLRDLTAESGSHYLPTLPPNVTTRGLLNLGAGAFDGATAGYYSALVRAYLAINDASSAADFWNFQNFGVLKARMTASGWIGIGRDPDVPIHIFGAASVPTTGATKNALLKLHTLFTNALNFGVAGVSPFYCWLQAQDGTTFSATYPLALNPVGSPVLLGLPASVADSDLLEGTGALWLDVGAAKLMFKVKQPGGTVKSGELAIA